MELKLYGDTNYKCQALSVPASVTALFRLVMNLSSFGLCPFQLWEGIIRGLALVFSLLWFTVSCGQPVPQSY